MKNLNLIVERNCANTPPCCFKRASRIVWVLILMLTIGVGQMWGENLQLTLSLTSNPGSWPTTDGHSTTSANATISGTSYSFGFTSSVYFNSSYLMMKSGHALGLPAISGYKLITVVGTLNSAGNPSTASQVAIKTASSSGSVVTGGTAQTWNTKGGSKTYNLSGTAANTRYWMVVSNKNCQMTNLVLTYEPVSSCTNPSTLLSISSSNTATLGTDKTLTTSGGNNGTVTWTVANGTGSATVSGNTLHPTSVGTVTVTATQDDNNGKCGKVVNQTITISKASANITLYDANGSSNPSGTFYGGDSYTPPTTAATCTGKVLVGWSTVEILEEGAKPSSNYADKGTAFTLSAGANAFYAVYAEQSGNLVEKTDDLTRATTGITSGSSTYSAWTNKSASNTGHSNAVYAGKSAGGNDAIQLRSSGSDEGLVTTTTGGNARKVTVSWESHTASTRTIDIYGKNTAYSSAADLFNANNQGTLLGNICVDDGTELTITGNYPYIGIRSRSSALYLSSVSIKWEVGSYTYSAYSTDCTAQGCENPTIETQPAASASYAKNAGSVTALSVAATGSGTLTYQWYSNDEDSNEGGTEIDGATSASYTPSVAAVGTKYYYCVVGVQGESCSTTSSVATINVTQAITGISLNKASTTIEVGSTETLTATISPNDATEEAVWVSSDATVATVEDGVVTAVKAGTATITCKSPTDNTIKGECEVTVTPAPEYKKVTAAPADWSGEYLLVYETGSNNEAYVWTGVEAVNSYATATISNNKITKPANGVKLTIAAITGGYSIMVNGGTNNGKYIYGTSGSNGVSFSDEAQLNTISVSSGDATITSNTSFMQYNSTADQKRFRYYKSGTTTQQDVQLYRKVATSAVTISAPEHGTITVMNGETPVSSGTSIEGGTVLTISGSSSSDAYRFGTISAYKTGDQSTTVTITNGQLTMPDYPITITADETALFAVNLAIVAKDKDDNVQEGAQGNTATIDGGTATVYKANNETVTLASTPYAGYSLVGWTATSGISIVGTTATITAAGTITATFKKNPCSPLGTPANVAVSGTSYPYDEIALNWDDVSNADHYVVSIKKGEETVKSVTVDESEYALDVTLLAKTTYTYYIQATADDEDTYCASANASANFATDDYPTVKLYYSENGTLSEGVDQKILTNFTLPNTAAECNKTFIGWTTNGSFAGGNSAPDPFIVKNTTWQIPTNAVCTLYAVYADVTEASSSWSRVTAVNTLTAGGTFILGYEGTANSGVIVPMRNSKSNATTSAQGYILSGTTDGSSTSGTITMSSLENSDDYEIAVESGSASGTIAIKIGNNYIGKGTSGNNVKLFASKSTLTDMTPELKDDDVIRLKFSNDSSFQYNNSGSARFTRYKNGQKDVVFYKKNVTPASTTSYSLTCQGKVAKPSITGVTGGQTYEEDQTVTITSATADATIKYTIDGSDPASSETTMASGSSFTLSENGTYTIRAIAVKDDMTNSDEATPISNVTIDKPYTTIASFIAAAPTNKKLVLTGAKVLGTRTDYMYVQDATGGIQLYKSSHGLTFASGKTLSGYVVGTYSNNNSSNYMPRLTFTDGSNLSVTEDAAALPEATVITAGSEANICKLVKLENVKFQSTNLSSNTVYVQKSDLDIDTVYNTFGVLNQTLPNSATPCDVTGVLIKYSGKYEIAPVSVDGITTKGALAILPTLSTTGSTDSENPTAVAEGKMITITPAAGMTSTYKDGDEVAADLTSATNVTIDEDKAIVVTASAYYYTNNSATYYYHADPSLTERTISKAAMTHGGVTVKIDDDEVSSAAQGATIRLLPNPATNYHLATISVTDADEGNVTLTEVTAGEEYTFKMPAKAVTVSATFEEDAKYTIAFEANGATSGDVPTVAAKYANTSFTVPGKNTLKKTGYSFNGWKVDDTPYAAGVQFTTPNVVPTTATTITFVAQWEPLPIWATTYTSNVTMSGATASTVVVDDESYPAQKAGSGKAAGNVNVAIPAGAKTVHFHASGWTGTSVTLNITAPSGITVTPSSVDLTADNGVSGSGTEYELENDPSETAYFAVTLSGNTDAFTLNFANTGNSKQFVLYGVNAIFPEITLSPTSYDFENVRANQTKSQEFTITANDNVIGDLSASITNDATGKYSVSDIEDNKVTVTFDPNGASSGTFTAKLRIAASNATVTADLTGTAIGAEAPEIVVNKNTVAFGQVDPNASTSKTIAVELLHIDGAVSADLSGANAAKFVLSTNSLTENGNLVITPVTTEIGIFSATLTLSATGADDVVIPLSITVANKWAVTYTSNVTVTAQENKKVKVGSDNTEYNAYKKGDGQNVATIHLLKGTQKLHLHMVAWNGESGTVTISGDCFNANKSIDVPANTEVSGTKGTYTFTDAEALSYYHEIAIDNEIGTGGTNVTIALNTKRIVLFGVNHEGGIYELPAGETDASTLPEEINLSVGNGTTLNINNTKTLNNLTVEAGGEVSGSAQLNVQDLTINSQSGKSGQVTGTNVQVSGDIYLEIKLDTSGTMDPHKWYCISAPFAVSAFEWGNGTPMEFNVDYQLFEYQGDKRARTGNGWQRVGGTMKANTAYFIGFDDTNANNQNVIKLKANSNTIPTAASMHLDGHISEIEGSNDWYGLGNPALHYVGVNKTAHVFGYEVQGYDVVPSWSTDFTGFVVGTAFFVQANNFDLTFNNAASAYHAPKRQAEEYTYCVEISREGASRYDNRVFVRASEDAESEFVQGKDEYTLNGTTSNYGALLWTENYGGKRLAIEEAPLVNGTASYVLTLSAPQAGTYSISVAAPKENADLYLTYEGSIIWNLSEGAYTMDLNKGITNGYGLILRANAPSAATGIDEAESGKQKAESVQKIILDEKVFILRGGKMYDVTGKAVK